MTRHSIVFAIAMISTAIALFIISLDTGAQALVVHADILERRDLETVISASGTVQPRQQVRVSARIAGRVTRLFVREGQRVSAGQLLLTIDPRPLLTEADRELADVLVAKSLLQQALTLFEQAKATLAFSRRAVNRQQELWKRGLATKEALERAEADASVRQAAADELEQKAKILEQGVRQQRAELADSKYRSTYASIVSPIDGVVLTVNVNEGENTMIGTGSNAILLTLIDVSALYATLEVDERRVTSLIVGQPANVTIDAMPGRSFSGHVAHINATPSLATNAGQGPTTFRVLVAFSEKTLKLRTGLSCTAEIIAAQRPQAISVPIASLIGRNPSQRDDPQPVSSGTLPRAVESPLRASRSQQEKGTLGVFSVRHEHAEFTPVTIGITGERYAEVLSGLTVGEMVITGPLAVARSLRGGERVRIVPLPGAMKR